MTDKRYPRIVRCPFTGVRARVKNARDEQFFYAVPLAALALVPIAALVLWLCA